MKILLPTLMLLGLMALVVPDPAVFQRLDDTGLSNAGTETRVVVTADVDGDGSLDVFLGNFGQDNDLHLNRGSARFDALPDEPVVTDGGFTFGAAFGDMDGDGDPDLAVANGSGADNVLYRNQGRPTKATDIFFAPMNGSAVGKDGGSSYDVDWADIDGDNDLDLLFANTLEPTFVYRNNGNGVFTRQTTGVIVSDNDPSRDLDTADLDGDGDVDVLIANSNDLANFVYINQGGDQGGTEGDFARLPGTDPLAAETSKSFGISTGDFDGDGDLDVFVSNRKNQLNTLYRNDGSGSFSLAGDQHPAQDGGDSYRATWGDIEGDGDLDLFVTNKDTGNFLYVNDGTDLLRATTGDAVTDGGNSRDAVLADLNRDGMLELVVANTGGEENFLYANMFSPWRDLGHAYQPNDAPAPHLSGAGTIVGHSAVSLYVDNGPVSTDAFLIAGASQKDMPFRGGVMVPSVDLIVPGFGTDAEGRFEVTFVVPGSVPAGTPVYIQCWMLDGTSPTGVVATNGLEATLN